MKPIYATGSLEQQEEDACTCGAGHGSGEGHMGWCDWLDAYSPPDLSERRLVRRHSGPVRKAVQDG